jgi:N,N-dimethylformamidase
MKKILGYTNTWAIAPGEALDVMVSTYGPERYRADLVRIICGDGEPSHDIYREEDIEAPFSGEYPGRHQPIDAGSYAVVSNSPELAALESFTVQAWVWPTTPHKGEQGLITRWDDALARGFALLIDDTGALAMRLGWLAGPMMR